MRDGPLRTGISPSYVTAFGPERQGGALVLTMEKFDRVGFRLPCADRVTTPDRVLRRDKFGIAQVPKERLNNSLMQSTPQPDPVLG